LSNKITLLTTTD